ncbi:MAG: 4Fe-4S ferredoxin [Desulfobacterium sp.]|nr:4Fe-4S ferredoxin [Desulfobacterium sp.]MBU3947409.1 4Fe-4S dicluster domain-containing protein [Pseudomonadota bacterium]MBU4010462.1 4Fe-4S dicluster domain-containing protein [Pseudomonadota bacterium]MBU4037782.1 4Fe-4S dicluster domain-containing protein [Pseudomonadota bacterium]
MKVIKIEKKDWAGGIGKIQDGYRLFGPVRGENFHDFKALEKGESPDLNFQNTRLSPKSVVYPQTEVLFEYSLDEKEVDHHVMKDAVKDYSPKAVLGIRPCDAAAFLLVKRNFDAPDYKDPYWLKSYDATTFIGAACNNPCSTCFCTTAGSGPFCEEGLDILLVDATDCYYAKAITAKGENLLKNAGWNTEADGGAAEKIETLKKEAEAKISSSVASNQLKSKSTNELYEASFWEDVSFACINCGTCTYLCPTCWCFDIQDENSGSSGIRMRNWDSCMFPLFTIHGTGHNPRGTKLHRVRQRFMHKLKYYVDKYDNGIQCVGCGRCVRACPVNIDIRRVCDMMNSYDSKACACSEK